MSQRCPVCRNPAPAGRCPLCLYGYDAGRGDDGGLIYVLAYSEDAARRAAEALWLQPGEWRYITEGGHSLRGARRGLRYVAVQGFHHRNDASMIIDMLRSWEAVELPLPERPRSPLPRCYRCGEETHGVVCEGCLGQMGSVPAPASPARAIRVRDDP
jgi:hypothetical protein